MSVKLVLADATAALQHRHGLADLGMSCHQRQSGRRGASLSRRQDMALNAELLDPNREDYRTSES